MVINYYSWLDLKYVLAIVTTYSPMRSKESRLSGLRKLDIVSIVSKSADIAFCVPVEMQK